jgi:carotenoid isomerooxygenase
MPDGTVYNLGLAISKYQPVYIIVCYPKGKGVFENAKIVAEVPVRWKLHPSYMHSFGITENFFIIIEQPLIMSIKSIVEAALKNLPSVTYFKAFKNENTKIYVIDRKSGKIFQTFEALNFFFFHVINQYEKDGHVVIDICCFEDHDLMSLFYFESLRSGQTNPFDFIQKSKALRFVLPLKKSKMIYEISEKNLVKLQSSSAKAFATKTGSVLCEPELLCVSCELPRFNYEKYLGRDYRYFYAVASSEKCEDGFGLVKVDVELKSKLIWFERDCYANEPIFVASPEATEEDDGVLLVSILRVDGGENWVGLLVLDAKTMLEVARCEFDELPGPVPKCFHGWFAENKS